MVQLALKVLLAFSGLLVLLVLALLVPLVLLALQGLVLLAASGISVKRIPTLAAMNRYSPTLLMPSLRMT